MHAWMHACVFVCTHAWALEHGRIYACANILMYACPRMYAFPRMHVHMHVQMYSCAILQAWERCRFREFAEMQEKHRLKQEEIDIKREIALK